MTPAHVLANIAEAVPNEQINVLVRRFAAAVLPSAKDRLAEEILSSTGAAEQLVVKLRFDEATASWPQQTDGRAAWNLAVHDVVRHLLTGENWVKRALWWAEQGCASWQQSAQFCTDVAHAVRARGHSVLLYVTEQEVRSAPLRGRRGRALLHLYLAALRADLRFAQIEALLTGSETTLDTGDPFLQAMHAFAVLGQDRVDASLIADQARRVCGGARVALHVLLHGLRLAFSLPSRAELILEIAGAFPFAGCEDAVVELRRAYALRVLRRFHEALDAIDRGIAFLNPADTEIHQEFVSERALILADHQRVYAERAAA